MAARVGLFSDLDTIVGDGDRVVSVTVKVAERITDRLAIDVSFYIVPLHASHTL